MSSRICFTRCELTRPATQNVLDLLHFNCSHYLPQKDFARPLCLSSFNNKKVIHKNVSHLSHPSLHHRCTDTVTNTLYVASCQQSLKKLLICFYKMKLCINFHFKSDVSFHLQLWQGSESTFKAFIWCMLALDLGSLSSCSREILETSSVSQAINRP